MTECKYCGKFYRVTSTPGFCTRQCSKDAPAARARMAALLAGELPPPSTTRTNGVDEIAVEIVANGIRYVPLNGDELDEVVTRMTRAGQPAHLISRHTRVATRTIHRRRVRLGIHGKQREGASLVVTRWEVTKAVRASRTMPAPSRLIMLTLADVAEVGTAEIPARWTPSLTVLAAETSLDRRTVQRHLDALEDGKWLARSRPPQSAQWYGERVRYALRVPPGVEVAVSDRQGGGIEPPGGWQETTGGGGTESQGGRHTTAPNQITRSESDLSSSSTSSTTKKPKTEPPRADVDKICNLLADRIAENDDDGVRPVITNEWRRSARLLLDKDKRTVDRVVAAIEWCQGHEFWHTNILSMPTLRKQYKQLQLKAKAERARSTRTSTDRPASNAPELIPAAEKCEHGRRETTCGLCRSEQIGRTS